MKSFHSQHASPKNSTDFAIYNPAPVLRINGDAKILHKNPAAEKIIPTDLEYLNLEFASFRSLDFKTIIRENKTVRVNQPIGTQLFQFEIVGIKEVNACQVYGSNITEIEESKAKLNSYALFARLNPEPVLRFDENGFILDGNPVAKEVFNVENIVGVSIKEHLSGMADIDIKQCIATGSIFTMEEDLGDSIYRFIVRGIPELNVCHMYGSDVTQRVMAERKVVEQADHIKASINAAKIIQHAVLPSKSLIDQLLPSNFVLFSPKDVVSGDFYWLGKKDDKVIIVAADCTGHGVPGGFMSMLGISNLHRVVGTTSFRTAADILEQLRYNIKQALEGSNSKDGMDVVVCIWDQTTHELQFAGAYNPLILIRNKTLQQFKGDKMSVGFHPQDHKEFTNHVIPLEADDQVYLFSDGYSDQFGGEEGLKLGSKRMREILLEASELPITDQKQRILEEFGKWKNENAQIDDIVMLGIKF